MRKQVRNKALEDFKKHVFKKIFPLFENADKKKLEKAIASKNLLAVSKALGLSKKELQVILGDGQHLAFEVFKDFLDLRGLIERLKEFVKKRSR